MRRRTFALASVAGMAVAALWATPALAHDLHYDGPYECGAIGTSRCGYGQVRSSHTIVDACDTSADGYGYSVSYHLRNGGSGSVGDANGSASGCGIKAAGTTSNPVIEIQPCSNQGGVALCSPWKAA